MNKLSMLYRKLNLSYLVLFGLLGLRFVDRNLLLIFNNRIPDWFDYYLRAAIYMIIAGTIWLNKNDLASLNIDGLFIKLFIFTGVLLSAFYVPPPIGAITGIVVIVVVWYYRRGLLIFQRTEYSRTRVLSLILLSLTPPILTLLPFIFNKNFSLSLNSIFLAVYDADLATIIFEEVLFRGLFWMFLSKRNLTGGRIVIIQAIVFWVSHYYYFSNTILFWITTPIISLLFGMIVLRTKSIFQSTCAHFAYNALILITKQAL
jgi:membrane protease YdiL (CAAX protease family)